MQVEEDMLVVGSEPTRVVSTATGRTKCARRRFYPCKRSWTNRRSHHFFAVDHDNVFLCQPGYIEVARSVRAVRDRFSFFADPSLWSNNIHARGHDLIEL